MLATISSGKMSLIDTLQTELNFKFMKGVQDKNLSIITSYDLGLHSDLDQSIERGIIDRPLLNYKLITRDIGCQVYRLTTTHHLRPCPSLCDSLVQEVKI